MLCQACGTETAVGFPCRSCGSDTTLTPDLPTGLLAEAETFAPAPRQPAPGAAVPPTATPDAAPRGVPDGATFAPTMAGGVHEGATFAPTMAGGTALPGSRTTPTGPSTGGAAAGGRAGTGGGGAAAPGTLQVGEQFGPRYHIIRTLGAGGMGAVYHAWDAELGVSVALKVIHPAYAQQRDAKEVERRFKQELVLARQVTHPNVVRIHDLGEVDGIKYISMPYVEGPDLAGLISSKGRLEIGEALQLARQVAAGLDAAHKVGIVHRDLKPANILIGDGAALITDFGIAHSQSSGATQGIVGTPRYMAPEQALGKAVDVRADIYAYGFILHEMLVGRPPAGGSQIEELQTRLKEGVPRLRAIDAQMPEPLDALVARCLEPDPSARYQTSGELIAALDRLDDRGELLPVRHAIGRRAIAAAVAGVVALVGATWWSARAPVETLPPAPVSVLVTDFVNRTGDAVFEGALEPALIQQIETASFVNAYPRTDAARIARATGAGGALDEKTARLVAIRENVGWVLAGAIERDGGGYRLTVRMLNPADETAEPIVLTEDAGDKAEVLPAIATIAGEVREALGDTSGREESATSETFTAASLDAVRSYTLAGELAVAERNEEAIEHYRRATQQDPNLGRAYSGWALSADKMGRKEEAAELWKKALALLDRMTERERYRTLGLYYSRVVRNQEKAIENFSELVRRYPADGAGHNNLALAYFRTLDFQKALESGRRVLDIYPRTLLYRNNHALYAMYASDFATADAEARKIIEEVPGAQPAYLPPAIAAVAVSGDVGAARQMYEAMAKTGALGGSVATSGVADLEMLEGRWDAARRTLAAGIAADAAAKGTGMQAGKLVASAEALLAQRQNAAAVRAVEAALALNRDLATLVPGARVLAAAGQASAASALAAELSSRLPVLDRAYGEFLKGEIAAQAGRHVEAIDAYRGALKLADVWLARYALGVAYVQAGAHAEALTELEACLKRRGEASSAFLDDVPTYRYVAPVYYWLGRAQEALQLPAARASYETYITLRKDASPRDPLAADAARRTGA